MKKLLLTYIFGCFTFFIFAQSPTSLTISRGFDKQEGTSRTLIVKLKEDIPSAKLQRAIPIGTGKSHYDIKQLHPNIPSKKKGHRFKSSFGLERIYKVKVPKGQEVSTVISTLKKYDFIEYAEPYYPMELLYTPSDPYAQPGGDQDHLELIKAYEAWEIEKGDSTIVIGILDTGANLNHEDLKSNIFLNEADPVNGFDDDGDGYVDNYRGWDFADGDNDPSDAHGHGTMVTGIAAAKTDNGIGIAGMGFKTKFMPVKVYTSAGALFNDGYHAILYAAEKGCKVINLSWGSPNSYSRYAEDIINTVVLDMDVVIVAAAGNSNLNEEYYPASYEYVLSVANTQKTDEKAEASTFSPYIDLSAPGINILTTSGSGYGPSYGTSMASPCVAGAAALIRAHFPELNALQVMERLRVTADDIYDVAGNSPYKELLGKGRLNMLRALTDTTSAAVRFRNMAYADKTGPYAFYDDTITITGQFVNYLHEASNLKVTLSIGSPYVKMIDSVYQTASLPTLGAEAATFKAYIKPDLPPGERLRFRLGFTADNYQDYQYFDIPTNPDYITLDNGKLAMTVGSNGNLGYSSNQFNEGTGITYTIDKNTEYLLDFASLIIGTSPENVSDNMFNSYDNLERAQDFSIEKSIKIEQNSPAFIKASATFSDSDIANPLGLVVRQSLSTYKDASLNDCLFLDYEITNNSGQSKDTVRVGIYADWDIIDSMKNKANYDFNYHMAYAYYPEKDIYGGIAILSEQKTVYQALSLYDENMDFVFGPEITEAEKFSLLVSDNNRLETGPANIASTLSAILYDLEDKEKASVQFAITAGKSLEALRENIAEALLLKSTFTLLTSYHFCSGDSIVINPNLGSEVYFYSDSLLTQLLGYGKAITLPASIKEYRLYMKRKEGTFYHKYKTFVQVEDEVNANFLMPEDSLLLEKGLSNNTLTLIDQSQCAVRWEWTVNNILVSHVPNPTLTFDQPGAYSIQLKVWNKANTVDSISKVLSTAYVTGLPKAKNDVIKVFPNPVSQELYIDFPVGKRGILSLTDPLGRVFIQKEIVVKTQPYLLDLSDLASGLYILQFENETENLSQKIIIQ